MSFTLITGCTGLVGHYLLRDLQKSGHATAVLVRPGEGVTAMNRVEQILDQWHQYGEELVRPVVLEGDLHEPDCGLSDLHTRWLRNHCERVVHSAASISFTATEDGEPHRTNVDGTRHLIEACREAEIKEFHHVSTAYVCGLRAETIMEHELDEGQNFRNDYEQSKVMAEKLVHQASFFDRRSIYRPPLIAGDSETGFTTSFHGLFHYLRLISLIVRQHQPGPDGIRRVQFRLPTSGDEPRNCVPIDWVSQAITQLINKPESHGQTFHLTAGTGITARQIIDCASDYYQSTGVTFGQEVSTDSANELELMAKEYLEAYLPYEAFDPEFDTTNLDHFLPNLPCPPISDDVLNRFIEFGEATNWGKKKVKNPGVAG